KTSGALVGSFAAPPLTGALAQVAGGKPALVPTELDSWIAVLPDGRVQAFFGKMDMGQGLEVAIAQIVADELDVACDKVDVLMGDTATSCNQGGASGSFGVSHGGRPPRAACKVRGVDESSIKGIRGARVVRDQDFVAVVAPREWDAVRAAQKLKVDWHTLEAVFPEMSALHEHIRGAKVVKREEPVK